jgi:hypothetical protein
MKRAKITENHILWELDQFDDASQKKLRETTNPPTAEQVSKKGKKQQKKKQAKAAPAPKKKKKPTPTKDKTPSARGKTSEKKDDAGEEVSSHVDDNAFCSRPCCNTLLSTADESPDFLQMWENPKIIFHPERSQQAMSTAIRPLLEYLDSKYNTF